MKIDFFIDTLGSGGAQNQILKLASGFKERGFQVRIMTYHEDVFYKDYIVKKGLNCIVLKKGSVFSRISHLRKSLVKNNTQVLISFLERPNIIAILASLPFRKWKLILGERSANPSILTSFKLKCFRILHPFANHIVANSKVNLDMVLKVNRLIKARKTHVIYNIVEDVKNLKSKQIEVNDKFKLIIGASLRDVKNSYGLVQAIGMLKLENLKKLQVIWFGDRHNDDESYAATLSFIEKNKLSEVITFYPATEFFRQEMSNATAVGLFSKFEGFPNVICEAMIQGKPIIATPVSDLPLIIPFKEQQLADSISAHDISKTLNRLIELKDDELSKLGNKNRKIASTYFEKDSILDQYQSLF